MAGHSCKSNGSYTMPPRPPRLFRAYLDIFGRICGPHAIEREFKTIDFLTLVDLRGLRTACERGFSSSRPTLGPCVLNNGRAMFSDVRSLFENVGHLQDSPIVIVPADNLNSDGQSAF